MLWFSDSLACFQKWSKSYFSLQNQYIVEQTSDENKDNHQYGNSVASVYWIGCRKVQEDFAKQVQIQCKALLQCVSNIIVFLSFRISRWPDDWGKITTKTRHYRGRTLLTRHSTQGIKVRQIQRSRDFFQIKKQDVKGFSRRLNVRIGPKNDLQIGL